MPGDSARPHRTEGRVLAHSNCADTVINQSRLPDILQRVSANLQKFVVSFVDTSALETVDEAETPLEGEVGMWWLTPHTRRLTQKFRYLTLAQREGGAFTLAEYRTNLEGQKQHPSKQTRYFIKTKGFAAMPLFFGALQQPWSDFRYLGRQKIHGVNTDVVAFAEHPSPAGVMGHFVVGEVSVPLLVQGVAWIRTSDDQISKIRTDLLTPLRPLMAITTVADFTDVSFKDSPTVFLLPKQVQVRVRLEKFVFANLHKYSDYRKFRVKSVIKAGP